VPNYGSLVDPGRECPTFRRTCLRLPTRLGVYQAGTSAPHMQRRPRQICAGY
jgi:hypothetical protein